MCWSKDSKILSLLGVFWGMLSLATLLTAFLSNVWLYTNEPIQFPNSDVSTTVTFKIGLWKICPSYTFGNATPPAPHLHCTAIKYTSWDDITATDLGIASSLEFTPSFLSKMRISTFFGAMSIILISSGTTFAFIGLFYCDHKTIVACGLFILGGLTLGGGLLIFASVLSDAYIERPKRPHIIIGNFEKLSSNGAFDYKYGWSFFTAGAAFFMAELAAVLCISAYVKRFPTVEDMVRSMVPGADRKLKEHTLAGEYLVQHKNKFLRQDTDTCISINSGLKCKTKSLTEKEYEKTDDGIFINKPAPDICASNPAALPESIISFGSSPASSKVLMVPPGTYCANPENSYIISEIGSVGVDSVLANSPLRGPLAGHTVPIVLMHHSQRPPAASLMFPTQKNDYKKNFKMSTLPFSENNIKHDPIAFPAGQIPTGTNEEVCFDQNFHSNKCNGLENRTNFGLKNLNTELGEKEATFFETFQGERIFPRAGVLDRSKDIPGTFSTTPSNSGVGSGATVPARSVQTGLYSNEDFAEVKRLKNATGENLLSNLEATDPQRN